jgi:hypothetical protein
LKQCSPRPRKSLRGVNCKTTVFGGRVGFDFTTRWYELVCAQHPVAQGRSWHHFQGLLAFRRHASRDIGHLVVLS